MIEVLPDPFGGLRVVDAPDRLFEVARAEPTERRRVGRRLHELADVLVGAEHQRHQRRAGAQPREVESEGVDTLGLHPFVPEDAAVDERLRRHLADDAGLLVVRGPQAIHVERRFGEGLEEPGVEEPTQGRDVRFVERLRVDLPSVRRIVRRPRDVQPRVRALGHDRRALLAGEGVVHRRDDVLRPLGAHDLRGERIDGAHPFASRNPAMYPTSASTPSSVIAL